MTTVLIEKRREQVSDKRIGDSALVAPTVEVFFQMGSAANKYGYLIRGPDFAKT
jgi:hypothetical protein